MLLSWSSAWIIFFLFFFADIYAYQLSWASSLKDETQPVVSNLRYIRSNISNPSTAPEIKKKKVVKKRQMLKGRQTNKEQQKFSNHEKVFLKRYSYDFKTDWCRIHQAKLDWKKYLAPCTKHTKWEIKYAAWRNIKLKTCAANSFISKLDIRPAGELSRFFIQSKTSSNHTKNIGGDSWRIHIKGTSSVSATVFDHNNGIYEVIFLLMEAGLYQIEINLDYTLCDGFKDPPVDWYKKGCTQGKKQPDGILKGDRPYLMESFGDGKCISMTVSESKHPKKLLIAMARIRKKFFTRAEKVDEKKSICDVGCPSLISDGLGRWINGKWKPFFKEVDVKREPHNHEGVLWIYGDSVSKRFADSLMANSPRSNICKKIFKQCKTTYTWIYNLENGCLPLSTKDGKDYSHKKVMTEISKVLNDKRLDKHSVIMLNWGIHFVYAVNFTNYRRLIDDFIETVEFKRKKGQFKGKIVWRTTTAIFRERHIFPHKDSDRFLTFPRIILYNAYAMSAMCRAGIDVIDVYPMTDSFPPGTVSKRDPLHYGRRALKSVEVLLYHKFKPS